VGSADQPSLLNPRFEPAMATRGGRRPRFEPSMATRGRRPPQHANSAQSIRQYNYVVDVDGGDMQTRTGLGVDTCTYLPVERRNAPPSDYTDYKPQER
jgi:hypothetical protein